MSAEANETVTIRQRVRYRYEQLLYWSSIALDATRRRESASVYVLGYIKSGTNWLCNLLSNVLELPVLESWNLSLPSAAPHVVHTHRFIYVDNIRRRTVYIARDGRDAILSAYFFIANSPRAPRPQLERLLGGRMSAENARSHLPQFIRFMARNRLLTVDYRTHIEESLRYEYVRVRYEQLLRDTRGELTRVVGELRGSEPDPAAVLRAVESNTFERTANRAPGEEDAKSFFRKGISGDWKNYFSRETAETFDEYAGQVLIDLGYEPDREWVKRIA